MVFLDFNLCVYVCVFRADCSTDILLSTFIFQNKIFVYRGLEYEKISNFVQRLQTEFPSAQILSKNTPPEDNIVNSDGQCKFLNI